MAYKFHGEAPQGGGGAQRQDHTVHRPARRHGGLIKAALLFAALIALIVFAVIKNPDAAAPTCVDIKSLEACGDTRDAETARP